jgi:hypothetical protein
MTIVVIAGLDPAIHPLRVSDALMDARVNPRRLKRLARA